VAVVDTGKACFTDEFSPTTSVKVLRRFFFFFFCFPFFPFFPFFTQYFFWFSAAAFCSGKRLLTFCVCAVFRLLRLQKKNSSRESELRVFLSRKVRTYGSSSKSREVSSQLLFWGACSLAVHLQ
jgi:hypothetical protein